MTKKKKTLSQLKKMKAEGQKIVCLTAYDAAMAYWVDQAGVDVILVGDSLGMVVQGHATTLPVSLNEMVYHAQMVQRGNQNAWCIVDLPFMSDSTMASVTEAVSALMKQGLANMVKLEGGRRVLGMVKHLSDMGVPVCGHLGLLPQSVEKNGYKAVATDELSARSLTEEALELEQAGADMLVLECVPIQLAESISSQLKIPVIGIGSGKHTDGQVLVVNDILGMTVGGAPKFAKNYLSVTDSIQKAIECYVNDVRSGAFPSEA